jgi:hypothetical protein
VFALLKVEESVEEEFVVELVALAGILLPLEEADDSSCDVGIYMMANELQHI